MSDKPGRCCWGEHLGALVGQRQSQRCGLVKGVKMAWGSQTHAGKEGSGDRGWSGFSLDATEVVMVQRS